MMLADSAPEAPRARLGVDAMVIAILGGLLVSTAEMGTLATARWIAPRIMRSSDSFIWVVPLYYVVVFSALGVALTIISWFLTRKSALRFTVICTASLAAFSILLLPFYGSINQWALMVMAVGIGVQVSRWAIRHETHLSRLRTVALLLALPIFLAAAGFPLAWRWQESAGSRKANPAHAGAPNVLLIILDTVRAASMGLYGNQRQTTPHLSRLAEHSIVFDRAYSTAPWTLPSHATMFTGRYPHELSSDWLVPLNDEYPTLAEVLGEAGYRTGGFVANMTYVSRETGLARGFVHYEDYPLSRLHLQRATSLNYFLTTWRRTVKPSRRTLAYKPAARINRDFLRWVDQDPSRPFLGFLNYFEAHQPYRWDPRFKDQFQSGNQMEEGYESAIATLDLELSRLRDSLDRRGLLQNTIVIITSDHGELLGEFNLKGHANSLYAPVLHVPLMISHQAGHAAPGRIAEPVTLRDLPATIAAMAGLSHRFPGSSLTRFWDSAAVEIGFSPVVAGVTKGIRTPPAEPVSLGNMETIIRGEHQLIVNGDGKQELYDLRTEPATATNLLHSSQYTSFAAELMAALRAATGGTVVSQQVNP